MAPKPGSEPGSEAEASEVKRGWFGGRRRPSEGEAVSAQPAPPPPPRKKRKGGLVALFSGMMTLFLIVAVITAGGYAVARKEFSAPGPLVADKSVIIERGSTTEDIAEQLGREGIVSRPLLLWVSLFLRDIQAKFTAEEASKGRAKSGEYLFRRQVTMNEVIDIITSGRSVEHTITIPEGLTSEQIVERLKENDLLVGEIAQIPAEGSLLPDTYKINRGTAREALLARMQREQRRVLQDIWNRRAKDIPLKNPRELVTLASIVEKETGRADERSRVAGVFVNRLNRNMKLQSDPTIIYGLVGGKATLGRGLLRSEIDRATPYNTYVINGLPPGPIANPGRAAMEATANPSRTKDLFFVADGTGGHAFSETLEQHNRNVARWRQIEATRGPATSPGETAPVLTAPPTANRTSLDGNAPAGFVAPGTGGSVTGFAPAPAAPAAAIRPQAPLRTTPATTTPSGTTPSATPPRPGTPAP
jgi:UPF0755 protein